MRLAAVAAVLLVGCSDPRDCSIGVVEGDFVGSAAFDTCGDLYFGDYGGPDAYKGAQACVIDHVQQQHPFFVRWRTVFVDTYLAGAYTGIMRDGVWTLAAFQQDGGAINGDAPAERDSCTDLVLAGSTCETVKTDLCIQCVGRKTADACAP